MWSGIRANARPGVGGRAALRPTGSFPRHRNRRRIAGVQRAAYAYDAMGRVTDYKEYSTSSSVVYERTAVYDAASLVTNDQVTSVRGSSTYVATSTYAYYDDTNGDGIFGDTVSGLADRYMGGGATHVVTTNTTNGVSQPTSDTLTQFDFTDGPQEAWIKYTPNIAAPTVTNTSTFTYDAQDHIEPATKLKLQDRLRGYPLRILRFKSMWCRIRANARPGVGVRAVLPATRAFA